MSRTVPLLAFLLVLSGCAAPVTPPTPGEPATDARTASVESTGTPIAEAARTTVESTRATTVESTRTTTDGPPGTATVESAELPTNESRIYDRVATLLDSDASQPEIRIVDAPDRGDTDALERMDRYERLLLDANDWEDDATASNFTAYYSLKDNRINVLFPGGSPGNVRNALRLEHVLAHEYSHAVMLNDEGYRRAMTVGRETIDGRMVSRSMNEGAAMYVTAAYGDEYVPEKDGNRLERTVRQSWNESEYDRYSVASYLFGHRYFDDRLDSPADLTRTYGTLPKTTEQLIHGYDPESEPRATLTVSGDGTGAVAGTQRDTTGELFVRSVLGGELPEQRAATAAAGWGNDRIVDLGEPRANESVRRNYAWALRWDDERNATEFARAFADYMDARGDRVGEKRWRDDGEQFGLRRASEETVVVIIGSDRVVQRSRLSGGNGTVTVHLPSG